MSPSPEGTDQNKVFALIISLFLLYLYKTMVWDAYFYPPVPAQGPGKAVQVADQTVPAAATADPAAKFVEPVKPAATAPANAGGAIPAQVQVPKTYPSDAEVRAAGWVAIESEDLNASVSLLGGRLIDFDLRKYAATNAPDSPRLSMIEHVEFAPYPLGVYSGGLDDSRVLYQLGSGQKVSRPDAKEVNATAAGAQQSVVLQGILPDGRAITKTISFAPKGYFVGVDVALTNPAADGSRLMIEWTKLMAPDSASLLDPYNTSGYIWFDGQKALRETFGKLPAEGQDLGNVVWVSMADKYFLTTMLAGEGAVGSRLSRTGDLFRARMSGSGTEKHMRLFLGPKNYRLLQDIGSEMHRNVDFGYTGVIAVPLLLLLHILYDNLGNFGLAIVMLTILVKLAMYPLTASSFKQMKSLQDIAPDLKRIRETVSDRQEQQLQTMQLYKDKGVNPLGGCLPIVLQMPVFIGLYSALLLDIELRHAPFALWIHDLSGPEKLPIAGFSIPMMVILFVISMLVQQWMTPSAVDPAQKKAMLIVPLVFGFLFASMPAGLTLYWLTNNLISIGQQSGFRKDSTKGSALKITLGIAAGVFSFAWVLTKI